MKVKIIVRDSMGEHSEYLEADRWYLDEPGNLIFKKDGSDIAMVNNDHWMYVEIVEERS